MCQCSCDGINIPVGPEGPAGAAGPQGIKGDTGNAGANGAPGYLTWTIAQAPNEPWMQLDAAAAYTTTGRVARFILKGSTAPTQIKIAAKTDAAPNTFKMRIRNMVTGLTVCEITGIANILEEVLTDMGPLANLTANDDLHQIEVQREGVAASIQVSAIYIKF